MPFRVRKQDCRQSDGTRGSFVVQKQEENGRWVQDSCHKTRMNAEQARIIKGNESEDV